MRRRVGVWAPGSRARLLGALVRRPGMIRRPGVRRARDEVHARACALRRRRGRCGRGRA